MKSNFKLVGVDCAVCAGKLEHAINKLPYIKSATLSFVDLKLYVETVDDFDKTEQELENMLQELTSKVLPNVIVKNLKKQNYLDSLKARSKNKKFKESEVTVSNSSHVHVSESDIDSIVAQLSIDSLPEVENEKADNSVESKTERKAKSTYKINWFSLEFIKVYISTVLFILGLTLPVGFWWKFGIYLTSYLVVGYEVIIDALKNIFKGKFLDEKFLTSLASIAAFAIKEMPEAVAVMLLYNVGELFQDHAVAKSRSAINSIVNLKADYANLMVDGKVEVVKPEELRLNDIILIKVGEKVPTDVVIVKSESNFDTSSITGESMPMFAGVDTRVYSGSINLSNAVYAKVVSTYENSTVAKILDLIENNSSKKSKAENFITKFARYYTPIVVAIAVVLFAFFPLYKGGIVSAIHKAAVFLVISCPCALVISIPLTYYCGLGVSARYGLLIKGANVLDKINSLNAICFDKTGTITQGKFRITEINSHDEKEMLKFLVYAESTSNHPISKCIVGDNKIDHSQITASKEIMGQGIIATVFGKEVFCGNEKLLENNHVDYNPQSVAGTIIYVATRDEFLGYVVVSDVVKDSSKDAIAQLKAKGIKTIMLTGDNKVTAEYVSYDIGIDDYKSELLPQDKVAEFEKINEQYKNVAFVGDGINDAPVLDMSSVGYSMGINGSDSAIECSDVVVMTDDLSTVVDSITIAKATRRIAIENITFCLIIKFIIMVLGAIDLAPMYLAIFADVGVSILAILNAIRMFTIKLGKDRNTNKKLSKSKNTK